MALGLSVKLLFAAFCCVSATSHENDTLVLNPSYSNIARGRRIDSTATCGEGFSTPGETGELYCKLTGNTADIYRPGEHVIIQGQYCDSCDPSDPDRAHPIEYAIDGTERWWQSPPLSRGMAYSEVNVTINLGQLYQIAYIVIKFANSPRPGMFILERSRDYGKTFEPWQYFAETPRDCRDVFGMESLEKIRNDDDVICTDEYSDIVPLEDGEIVVSLVNNRPGAPHSATLQEWIKATHIRIRLLRTNTLLGHLMAVARQDPTITRRYYYSLKDITIGGRCACNGHASYCDLPAIDNHGRQVCRCEHNTCGDECDACCPGYVQKAWRASTYGSPFTCERCNCHSHAIDCVYDPEVAANSQSLDVNGNLEGGGVCQNCQHNTMGVNCEQCKPGFFRPVGREVADYDVCQPCNCDPILSTGNCAPLTGVCECKPEYAGPDCTECNDGYYGYPNCRPCDCNVNGTQNKVCQVNGGQCPCKPNYTGRNCNLCALSYYGFPECKQCECNPIGSYDIVCDSENGQCRCRDVYDGRSCDACQDGYYNFPTCRDCSCSAFGTLEDICNKTDGDCLCRDNFAGDRCDQCAPGFYNYPECLPCECDSAGSLTDQCGDDGQCLCAGNFNGLKCDRCADGYYKYPTCEQCSCDRYGSYDLRCDQLSGQCTCRSNFQGRMCERCGEGFYNFPSCEECNCDPAGVIDVPGQPLGGCGSATGGACLCKDNVMGRTCDTCKPLYWNLEISNPYGCEDCGCNQAGTVNSMAICAVAHAPWHKNSGQCYCKSQVTGRICDECRDGTFALDASNPLGCQDCNCDVGGSVHSACDKRTGQCVCRPRVTGVVCNMPERNHFVPDLHQMKFEAEDGYTPNARRVRFGYSNNEFPDYSYLGYAIMDAIQPIIRIPITVESPSIYRIILRYHYPVNTGPIRGKFTVTPEGGATQVSEQSSGIIFVQTDSPQFVTIEGSGVIRPFVLNPGSMVATIEAPEGVLIDYIVLLPSDFYEATILQEHTTEACIAGAPQERCNYYVFPDVDQFFVVPGVDGYFVDGSGSRYPVQRFGDDYIMQELGVDSMALVDTNQNLYGIDLPITEAGKYVVIFEYYGGGPGQQSAIVDVEGTDSSDRGYLTFDDCSYLCRSIVLDDDSRVKVFDIRDVMPYAQVTKIGNPYMVAISRVIVIPVDSFAYDFVTPTLQCVRGADGSCLPSTYPVPPNTILLENVGTDPTAPLPPNIYNPSPTVTYLSTDTINSAYYENALPNSGQYVFVVHYYQPSGESFNTDFRLLGQFDGDGTFNAQYCPQVSGCRVVVTKPDGSNEFELSDLTQGIQINLPEGANNQLWIDDILVIPVEMYTPDVVNPNPQDRAGEFLQYCSSNDFYFSPESSGFCREAVFSLSSAFNYGASECNCDSQGSRSFNCDELGGQCSCRQNIVGRQCDKCAVGYYSFPSCFRCTCQSGVCNEVTGECICPENVAGANCNQCAPRTYGYHPIAGCVDCECDARGVANDDLNCDVFTGQCNCKENIGGRQCERCELGYHGYPFCEQCNCDTNGTTSDVCDQTTAQCLCKDNVVGGQCNQCASGTYHLAESNPQGCISCFCFGVSTSCTSFSDRYIKIRMADGWTTVNFPSDQIRFGSNIASIYVDGTGENPQNAIYWEAPDKFKGSKLTSYGGKLEYSVRNNPQPPRGDGLGVVQPLRRPDIVISGNNVSIMYIHIETPDAGVDMAFSVDLTESNFQYSLSGRDVSREDFMMVLSNINSLQIRAQYFDRILNADLIGVAMDMASRSGDGAVASEVEQCRCPPQYQGLSCESCAPGYYRLQGSGSYLGQCVRCNCNGHADICDERTGQCLSCQDNTEGINCERCKSGYYGDATTGEVDACKICSCPQPVEELNFAETCVFSPTGEQLCICLPGHTGQYCESCVAGYFGNPSQGEECERCDCSGNTDNSTGIPECDETSGICRSCRVGTKGQRCELCDDWYHGNARTQDCRACACDRCGSDSCESYNGLCNCKPNVVGYNCEECAVGYWNYEGCQGCEACDCGVASMNSQCDPETGQCSCMPGVGGAKCDACLHGYWNYGPNGCFSCNCDPKLRCDPNTGECLCPPGAMGENCDECEPRYILTENGCEPCDECVHLLLDMIDEMSRDLDAATRNLTDISVGVIATQRLNRLNASIQALQPELDTMKDTNEYVRNALRNLTSQVQQLDYDARNADADAKRVNTDSDGTATDAENLKARAEQMEADANAAIEYVYDVVRRLQAIESGTTAGSNNLAGILAQAEAILDELRRRDLRPNKQGADYEKQLAEELLERALNFQNTSLDVGQQAEALSGDLEDFIAKLLELRELCDGSGTKVDQVDAILTKHRNPAYEEILLEVAAKERMAKDELANSTDLLDQADGFLADTRRAIDATATNGSKLQAAISQLVPIIERYERESEGLPELVDHATEYANNLSAQADYLSGLFEHTRDLSENALKAANAYQDIVNAINEAELAAQAALNASQRALDEANGFGTRPLDSKRRSRKLLRKAAEPDENGQPSLYNQSLSLRVQLNEVEDLVDGVNSNLSLAEDGLAMIERGIASIPIAASFCTIITECPANDPNCRIGFTGEDCDVSNMLDDAQGAINTAMAAEDIATDTRDRAQAIVDASADVKAKLIGLDDSIRMANDNMFASEAAIDTIRDLGDQIPGIRDNMRVTHRQVENMTLTMDYNLAEIQKKIAQARSLANGIKVAAKFGPDSYVEMKAPDQVLDSSPISTLSFYFTTTANDGLLYYVGGPTATDDYMALTLENGQVVLHYDLGDESDTAVTVAKNVADGMWRYLLVERFGRYAKVTVTSESTGQVDGQADSRGEFALLDLTPDSLMYMGGAPDSAALPDVITNRDFVGGLDEFQFGDTPIGIWNFVNASAVNEGIMRNVTDLSVTTDPEDPRTAVMFDGLGYAVIPRGTKTMDVGNRIQLKFKTFAPNGLLLFAGSENEYLTLELRDGRVHYEYNLGSGSVSKTTPQTYNNNEWTTVIVSRTRQETLEFAVSQQAYSSEFAGFNSPGRETSLATDDLIYIGGLLDIPDDQFPQVTRQRFRGCMDSIAISLQNVDLTSAETQSAGFFPTCLAQDISVASYAGPKGGFTELVGGPDLVADGNFLLRFRTNAENGLMLYTANAPQTSSLAVLLNNGAVYVAAQNEGTSTELISNENNYNDGEWHTINVRRPTGKAFSRLVLSVDDTDTVMESFASRGVSTDDVLYLGGVPEGYDLGDITLPPTALEGKFVGCLADFTSLFSKVSFANRALDSNAYYGFCDPNLIRNASAALPTVPSISTGRGTTSGSGGGGGGVSTTPRSVPINGPCQLASDPEGSRVDPSNENAKQFGILPNSHVEFAPLNRNAYRTMYNISVAVRTGARNGLIYYAADGSQIDLLTLFLRDGQPVMVFNLGSGNLRLSPSDGRTVNDAQWHTIRTVRNGLTGQLFIDGELVATATSQASARFLTTVTPFFWGGVSSDVPVNSFDVDEASQISLLGCMKDLTTNGVPFGPQVSEYETQACSQVIEPGVYFGPGKGYVVPEQVFYVNRNLEVKMSIKPRVKTAVIFSVAKPRMDYLSLEMVDGVLFLRVENGAGEIVASYSPPEGSAFLCDGNWHDILVKKEGGNLQITVDGDAGPLIEGSVAQTSANTADPLYFGGLPTGEEVNHPGIVENGHYVGCMRDIMVNEDLVDLSTKEFEGDVNLRSCYAN